MYINLYKYMETCINLYKNLFFKLLSPITYLSRAWRLQARPRARRPVPSPVRASHRSTAPGRTNSRTAVKAHGDDDVFGSTYRPVPEDTFPGGHPGSGGQHDRSENRYKPLFKPITGSYGHHVRIL